VPVQGQRQSDVPHAEYGWIFQVQHFRSVTDPRGVHGHGRPVWKLRRSCVPADASVAFASDAGAGPRAGAAGVSATPTGIVQGLCGLRRGVYWLDVWQDEGGLELPAGRWLSGRRLHWPVEGVRRGAQHLPVHARSVAGGVERGSPQGCREFPQGKGKVGPLGQLQPCGAGWPSWRESLPVFMESTRRGRCQLLVRGVRRLRGLSWLQGRVLRRDGALHRHDLERGAGNWLLLE